MIIYAAVLLAGVMAGLTGPAYAQAVDIMSADHLFTVRDSETIVRVNAAQCRIERNAAANELIVSCPVYRRVDQIEEKPPYDERDEYAATGLQFSRQCLIDKKAMGIVVW